MAEKECSAAAVGELEQYDMHPDKYCMYTPSGSDKSVSLYSMYTGL